MYLPLFNLEIDLQSVSENCTEKSFLSAVFNIYIPLQSDPWAKGRKIRNLHYDYCMPAFPHDQPEDTAHSQRRDLKDIENSLIQLTASLDLMQVKCIVKILLFCLLMCLEEPLPHVHLMHLLCQEEPERPLPKNTDAVDLGLETFHKRQTQRDHADKS